MENTYTDDEVREMLTDIGNVIASEIECELINSSHTNVLVLQQVFAQAQKWHLDLDADLAELENRGKFTLKMMMSLFVKACKYRSPRSQ